MSSESPPPGREHDPFAEVFRDHYGRVVAGLVRMFGASRIELAEDCAQDAMLRAVRTWPFRGRPDDPAAWLLRVARNRALDQVRCDRLAEQHLETVGPELGEAAFVGDAAPIGPRDDDSLALLFLCCDDDWSPLQRVTMTLKTLCGFGVKEIAAALLEKEATVAQRLSRLRSTLHGDVRFELPTDETRFRARLASVLDVLYLMFNEGYRAHGGDGLVREELVREALRLAWLLDQEGRASAPELHALTALMLFQGARLDARLNDLGEVLTLAEQDRSLWRRDWIALGFDQFQKSLSGERLTVFHVEAAIGSVHAAAPSAGCTDWAAILARYDQLLVLRPDDPLVTLNRSVAVAKVSGPGSALDSLEPLTEESRLRSYSLLHATRGQYLWMLGRNEDAVASLARARELSATDPERSLLERRASACARGESPPQL